ncbi:MAG: hypothetical protein NC299_11850, partial [Lachnospiraceae bacterium]|nr:hypothetical protein [Lachnospiraceae bacterium]
GDGSGSGLIGATINSMKIYGVDDVPTVIYRVYKDYAKGAVVNDDLTLTPCYIAKGGNRFAHGETLRKAVEALQDKLFENMPAEERVEAFCEEFKPRTAYTVREFYKWHNKLTGSCEMGRTQFAKEHNIDLDGEMTVEEFIKLTEHAYGGDVIQMLKPHYKIKE